MRPFIPYLLFISISVIYPQCDNNEIEIWKTCYSIENTTIFQNPNNDPQEFPSAICGLINLEIIDLDVIFGDGNFLFGQIPDCIGNLEKLTYLNLSWNALSGEIPKSIGNLLNLTYLNLLSNQFSGPIPTTIGNLNNILDDCGA